MVKLKRKINLMKNNEKNQMNGNEIGKKIIYYELRLNNKIKNK
jgi:hypothetical protein